MAPELFPMTLYKELQEHDRQGNFNEFLLTAAGHMGSLLPVKPEILKRASFILSKCGHLISPVAKRQFHASLTRTDLKTAGLGKSTVPSGDRVCSSRGRIHFPLFSTGGQVRELLVSMRGTERLMHRRLALLDVVGSSLFNALEKHLGKSLLWNPFSYFFSILDPIGAEDPYVRGESMGLPLAIALYSHVTGVRIPSDLSATGMIMRTGDIEPVEYIEEKLAALKRERYFIKRVVVSEEQVIRSVSDGLRIIRARNLEAALAKIFPRLVFPVSPACSLDIRSVPEEIEELYDAHIFEACIDKASTAIGYLRGDDCRLPTDESIPILFSCYWRRGSCYGQIGNLKLARRDLQHARKIYENNPGYGDFHDYLESLVNLAVLLRDLFRYRDAEALHREIAEEMKAVRAADHEKGKNMSALSQLYLAKSRFPEAEKCQKKALKLVLQNEKSRSLGYLGRIYARWGKFDKASKALAEAERMLRRAEPEVQQQQMLFYHWNLAEFLYRLDLSRNDKHGVHLSRLAQVASRYPDINDTPSALIHRYYGLALLQNGREKEGLKELEKVIHYFSEERTQQAKILQATVLAGNAAYFLERERDEEAIEDITRIRELISSHDDIHRFFKADLRRLTGPLKTPLRSKQTIRALIRALENFQFKIPY